MLISKVRHTLCELQQYVKITHLVGQIVSVMEDTFPKFDILSTVMRHVRKRYYQNSYVGELLCCPCNKRDIDALGWQQ